MDATPAPKLTPYDVLRMCRKHLLMILVRTEPLYAEDIGSARWLLAQINEQLSEESEAGNG